MKKIYIIGIIVVVLGAAAAWMFVGRSDNKTAGTSENSKLKIAEGQVELINQPNGACKSYQIGENVSVAVECPGMAGNEGFVGEYDQSIKVGDKVTVRGNQKTADGAARTTYHLDQPGTYLRKAE